MVLVMYEVTLKRMDSSFWPQVFNCIQQFLLLCLDDTSNIFYQSLISGLNFSIIRVSCVTESSLPHMYVYMRQISDMKIFSLIFYKSWREFHKATFHFLFISEKRHTIGVQCSCNFNTISLFLNTETCKVIKHDWKIEVVPNTLVFLYWTEYWLGVSLHGDVKNSTWKHTDTHLLIPENIYSIYMAMFGWHCQPANSLTTSPVIFRTTNFA